MKVKIKKLCEHATIPFKSNPLDAGMDLVAVDHRYDREYDFDEFGTGIAIELPPGYVGLVFPRSSISRTPHALCNSVGVVDASYQGEIKLRFRRTAEAKEHLDYCVGDRIGQLIIMPIPTIDWTEVKDFTKVTNRGSKGFGSTGR